MMESTQSIGCVVLVRRKRQGQGGAHSLFLPLHVLLSPINQITPASATGSGNNSHIGAFQTAHSSAPPPVQKLGTTLLLQRVFLVP